MSQLKKNQFNYFMALARVMEFLDELEQKNPLEKEALEKVRKIISKLAIEFLQEEGEADNEQR